MVLGLLKELRKKQDKACFKDIAVALGILADKLAGKYPKEESKPANVILKFPGYKNEPDKDEPDKNS